MADVSRHRAAALGFLAALFGAFFVGVAITGDAPTLLTTALVGAGFAISAAGGALTQTNRAVGAAGGTLLAASAALSAWLPFAIWGWRPEDSDIGALTMTLACVPGAAAWYALARLQR